VWGFASGGKIFLSFGGLDDFRYPFLAFLLLNFPFVRFGHAEIVELNRGFFLVWSFVSKSRVSVIIITEC